ncbi:uncharacterized protein DS421_7g217460 [Arachis hypogaea]|nr:uncharacterized protein DS421_7g217460 [Arachis hypogaea]
MLSFKHGFTSRHRHTLRHVLCAWVQGGSSSIRIFVLFESVAENGSYNLSS